MWTKPIGPCIVDNFVAKVCLAFDINFVKYASSSNAIMHPPQKPPKPSRAPTRTGNAIVFVSNFSIGALNSWNKLISAFQTW